MKKLILFLFFTMSLTLTTMAQNITVHGKVTLATDGEPVVGASVVAKGTKLGTLTDIDGKFRLSVPQTCKKLTISYIGMFPVEVDVKPEVNIVMEENRQMLDEVVVTGYGVTKKAAFTGSASVVDGDVVDKKSDMNFVKSLEGQVTGLQYSNVSNSPGMMGSVAIRGLGTIYSNGQPLYVIDGVPVNSDVISNSSSSSGNYFDPMASYNPNDIESITVLKDAAATAIYGARAANGVIVITTKKGGQGNLNITFETRQGFNGIANNNMKMANASQMMPFLAGGLVAAGQYDNAQEATEYLTGYFKELGWDGHSSYDWLDAISRKGYYSDYNLSINGSNSSTNYYINLNYNQSQGAIIASDNTRYGGRANIDTKYKWLSVGLNSSFSYSVFNGFSQSTSGAYANPVYSSFSQMNVFMPFRTPDGEYANCTSLYNPLAVWDKELGDLNTTRNQVVNLNPWLMVNLPYGFWVKTNFGANLTDVNQYIYNSALYNRSANEYNGKGLMFDSYLSMLTWTNTIGWIHSYGEHNLNVLLGQEMQRRTFSYNGFEKTNFPYAGSGMRDIATAATEGESDAAKEETRLASYFGDVHYDYDNRYFLSASFRRDGSSVFGKDSRWANFWSVGAKWRITQEKWLQDNTVLTNADIRISYGTVGNQSIGAYSARGIYSLGYNYDGNPGMVPTSLSNPKLTWETSKKFDVGFDLSFISRWFLTFDFYNEDTSNLLYQVPLSMTTGLSNAWSNVGRMRNRGVEIGINGTAFHTNDVAINVFANLTMNRNKVVELNEEGGKLEYNFQIVQEGYPYWQWWMKEYAGVNPENGRAQYYLNETGDELTESYEAAAKRYLGSPLPKAYGAFGVNANFYGVDFSIQFNYRLGTKLYNSLPRSAGWGYLYRTALLDVVENSWTPENPEGIYPRYIYGDPYKEVSSSYSSRFLMNGDYLRISNITLGYTLPSELTNRIYLKKVRFYLTVDNPYTFMSKDFKGYTPDTRTNGNISSQYPGVYTFTGGVQLTF